jgi:cytoskeleton-associated protein 5
MIDSTDKQQASRTKDSLITAVVKLAPDADASIRENAQAVLVAYALKLGSYNAIQSFLSKLDDSRAKMIEEAVMEAAKSAGPSREAGGKKPSAAAPATSSRPPTRAASTAAAAPAASSARTSPKALAPKNATVNITASRPAISAASSKSISTSRSRPAVPSSEDDSAAITSGRLSIEEADQMLTDAVGAAVVEGLRSPQWQARLESVSTIAEHATSSARTPEAASVLLCLAQRPGWGDKNFQVVNKCLEVAAIVAKECPGYGKLHAAVTVEGAGDKIHELKHRIPATDALNAACEAIGPRFVLAQLHSRAGMNKNPKVLSESLAWMTTVVEEFGLAAVDLSALLGWLIADLGSPNAPVRNQAMAVLGRCHAQVGGGLMSQLADSLKPAQVTALEEIFRKNPVDPEFQPTRKVRGKKRAVVASGEANAGAHSVAATAEDDEDFDEPAASLEDLLPRASIASSLTPALIGQISSSNWKERISALEEIENLIKSAGNRIQPDIPAADLFLALRGRMADTNRNLAARTLLLLGKLAEALGQPFDKLASRSVLVPALNTLSDNKKQVRDAVIVMLDSWVTTCPAEKLIAPVADVVSNAKVSADGRVAALTWMAKVMMTTKIPGVSATTVKLCTESALRAAVVALGDKAAAVRDGGSLLITETAIAVGGDEMLRALGSLDSTMKKTAEPWVMKAVASAGTSTAAAGGDTSSRPASGKHHVAAGSTPAPSERPSTRSAATAAAATAVRPSTLSINENDSPPLLSMSSAKAARSRSFRPRPGKFEAPPLDELETLDAAFTGIASDELRSLLFSRDFKDHVKAADSLANVLVPDDLLPEGIACLDIIFRWTIVRICEGNTQVLVRVLEMLRSILDALLTTEYRLTEVEAAALLPGLIEKSGHNQDRVRGLHRDVLHGVCAIYSTSRVLDYLTVGLGSKSSRTKIEICDAIAAIVERDGVSVLTTSKAKPMLSIASTLKERDGTLRTAALGVIEEVWAQEGPDTVWKLLGRLENRERDMVDDRLKRSSRQAGTSQPNVLANSSVATTRTTTTTTASSIVNEDHSRYQNTTPEFVIGGGGDGVEGNLGTAAAGELAYSRPAFTPPNALDMTPPTAIKAGAATPMEIDGRTPYRPHAVAAAADADAVFGGMQHQQQQHQSLTPVPRNLPPTPTPQAFHSPHLNTKTASSPIPATGPHDLVFEQRWNEYLATMASPSLVTAVNATKQLCAEIMHVADPAAMPPASRRIRVVMGSSAERLFNVVLAQLVQIFDEAAKEAEAGTAPSSRGCKFALNLMLQGMGVEEIAGGLPQGTLRHTISLLLCRLVDERGLLMFEEGTTLVRAVNVLIAKMLDSANRNYSFAALLQVLREPPPGLPETAVPKFNDLVVKCLIKLTKGLQTNMDGVDMSALLLNIHDFFMFLGVDEIRRRSSADDKPLRMVKTVLHELCKMAGHGIYVPAAGIPGRKADPQPIIFAYISLNLSSLEQSGLIAPATGEEQHIAEIEHEEKEMMAAKAAAVQASLAGEDGDPSSFPGGAQPYSGSANIPGAGIGNGAGGGGGAGLHDDAVTKADVKARLKGIMTRLVQRDTAQQKVAMVELFYLRKESPEMVERLVFGKAGTSVMFREFIENGLAELEKNGVPASGVGNSNGAMMSRVGSSVTAAAVQGNGSGQHHTLASGSSLSSPAAPGSAKLSSLRERLSSIKSGDAASSGVGHSSTIEELTARMQMLRRGAGN